MLTITHEYMGWADYWGGNGRRWDDDAGCLFAYYDSDTTVGDCVDQWVQDWLMGGDCDSMPDMPTSDLRSKLIEFVQSAGFRLSDLVDSEINVDGSDYHPAWIVLLEST